MLTRHGLRSTLSRHRHYTVRPKWEWEGTLMYLKGTDFKSTKVACFDFDGTLVDTSVRRRGKDAWKLLFPNVPMKLSELEKEGYKIVIFSNQGDIGRTKKPDAKERAIEEKQGRFLGFVEKCNNILEEKKLALVNPSIFVATAREPTKTQDATEERDKYRKPETGMWNFFITEMNGGMSPDLTKSFFVGDAAGRDGDHSQCDSQFAQRIGLAFHLPETFFTE